jgi:predicted nucleic acid-binding protein
MKVFWDTNVFIYLFEDHGAPSLLARSLWRRMVSRGDTLATSTLTLGECLVGPARAGLPLGPWEERLRATARLVPFDAQAALRFAAIRADRTISAPDAIQLACAAAAGAGLFVTNDSRLSRKNVPGVPIMTSLEAVPI